MANSLFTPNSSKNYVLSLIVFVLAFDLALVGQKLGGAYQNEFGGHPHEASHYMAGLFWRDFVVLAWRARAEGKSESWGEERRDFAANYKAHYPHLETGSERSLFTGVEAVWMLAFPATRGWLLALLAALSGIAATQLFRALQQEYGWGGAGLAAAALVALPLMRRFTGLVMPDALSVVLVFGACMAFGDFLDRERKRDAWLAGILGGLAILNSAWGGVAAPAIVLGVVMARRFRALRMPAFWGMVILLVAAAFLRGEAYAVKPWNEGAVAFYAGQFWNAVGAGIGALMIAGIVVKLRGAGEHRGRWATAGGLLAGTLLWMAFMPGDLDARRLLPALPPALMFALAGGAWVMEWLGGRSFWSKRGGKFRTALAAILGLLAIASASGSWRKERCTGFAPLAETLLQDSSPDDVTLVSSDATGEERFIAELAMREHRPGHTVLCGTRLLAKPGRKAMADEPAFPSDQAVFDFLTSGKVKYVVLDDAIPDEERREHHYQIRRAIEEHLSQFWSIADCPVTRDGITEREPVKLYKIKGIK